MEIHRNARRAAPFALLAVLCVAAFSNSNSDRFLYTSPQFVRDNDDIAQLESPWRAMSLHLVGEEAAANGEVFVRRPLLSLSFALSKTLLGNEAWKYRATNVGLHLCSALLLFAIIRRTLRRLPRTDIQRTGTAAAALAAALWMVHPMQTEAVNLILARSQLQVSLLILLSLFASIRFFETTSAGSPPASVSARQLAWAFLGVVSACAAMLTKETAAVAPLVIWLYLRAFFPEASGHLRRYVATVAIATWTIAGLLVAATLEDVQSDLGGHSLDYLLTQPSVILRYFRIAIAPTNLSIHVFDFDGFVPRPSIAHILVVLGLAATSGIAAIRGSRLGFLGACVFLLLAPTSSFLALTETIHIKRFYLALAPFVIAIVAAAVITFHRLHAERKTGKAGVLLLGAIASICVALFVGETRRMNLQYHDPYGATNGSERVAAMTVAGIYELTQRQNPEQALEHFRLALDTLGPDAGCFLHRDARRPGPCRVGNFIGVAHVVAGDYDAAIAQFEKLAERAPEWTTATNNLAATLILDGSPDRAARLLAPLATSQNVLPSVAVNYAVASLVTGEMEDAREYFDTARTMIGSAVPWLETQRLEGAIRQRNEGPIRIVPLPAMMDGNNGTDMFLLTAPAGPVHPGAS